jgi:hypothetical protein
MDPDDFFSESLRDENSTTDTFFAGEQHTVNLFSNTALGETSAYITYPTEHTVPQEAVYHQVSSNDGFSGVHTESTMDYSTEAAPPPLEETVEERRELPAFASEEEEERRSPARPPLFHEDELYPEDVQRVEVWFRTFPGGQNIFRWSDLTLTVPIILELGVNLHLMNHASRS